MHTGRGLLDARHGGNAAVTAKSPRVRSLDGLRFLMCVGIAIYHYSEYIALAHDSDPIYYISRFAYFTDIFFVMSGYFVARSYRAEMQTRPDHAGFLVRRLARLYPLYALSVLFFLLIGFAYYEHWVDLGNPARYDLHNAVPHLLLIQSWSVGGSMALNYAAWSLSVLWLCYLLLPLLIRIADLPRGVVFWLIAAMAVGFDAYGRSVVGAPITDLNVHELGLLRGLPSVLFGIAISRTRFGEVRRPLIIWALAGLTAVMFLAPDRIDGAGRLLLVYSFFVVVVLADRAAVWTPLAARMFEPLSRYSYGIYIIHPMVGTVLLRYLGPKVFGTSLAGTLADVALGLSVVMLGAVISYRLIEQPANRAIVDAWRRWRARGIASGTEPGAPVRPAE